MSFLSQFREQEETLFWISKEKQWECLFWITNFTQGLFLNVLRKAQSTFETTTVVTSFWCVLVLGSVRRLIVMVTSGGGVRFCSPHTVTHSGPLTCTCPQHIAASNTWIDETYNHQKVQRDIKHLWPFDPRPCHTKDVIKMVPDAFLLSAQHIRTGLASLSSQTSFKKRRWIPSGMCGRVWLI